MKLQDVMLRAMAKGITWYQAAEILGGQLRQMQRWKTRFEHEGDEGFDHSIVDFEAIYKDLIDAFILLASRGPIMAQSRRD